MGAQESHEQSKSDSIPAEEVHKTVEDSTPSSPISLLLMDPRSPSTNVARTPLETVFGRKETTVIPDYENDEELMTPVALSIDPRSPTVDFERTPIVVSAVIKDGPTLHNKNLDNARKTLLNITQKMRTPRLLERSPIVLLPATGVSDRNTLVRLLETNLDFTETDLDSVTVQNMNKSLPVQISEESVSPISNKLKTQMEALQLKSQCECEEEYEENVPPQADPDTVFPETISLLPAENTINITANVKNFGKKLSNLIYEDADCDDEENVLRHPKVKELSRTPLGTRNSNGESKKSATLLKVSDKPRKSESSRIPILKDFGGRKIPVQCENTPPKKMEKPLLKPRTSRWDTDKTLVI